MNQSEGPISPTSDALPGWRGLQFLRNSAFWILRWSGRLLILLNGLALLGHFTRGRAIALELLLYFPLVLLGIAAILAGALIRGTGLLKEGTAIAQLGVASVIISLWWMVGQGPLHALSDPEPSKIVRILHWNVLWGGLATAGGGWSSIVEEIVARKPDVVVLSEAAPAHLRRQLLDRLGEGWNESAVGSPLRSIPYQYQMAVLSRWPTKLASRPVIRNGTACEVIVEHPVQPIRVLAIDGKSTPTIPRSMMLEDIAAICERSAEVPSPSRSGPIDIVAGDFNCVGRTRGFDQLREVAGGYSLASESSMGWRATWPSWLPLYDIDHVWVRNGIAIQSCSLFSRFASDHRGQIIELALP